MDELEQMKNGGLKPVQQVPEGFFEQFSTSVIEKIRAEEELQLIAPTLVGLSRKPVQFVPAGYFDEFAVQVTPVQAPIVKMGSWRKIVSYAAAAVVAGVLVTGAFLYQDSSTGVSFNYEYYSKIDVSAELNKVSDETLDQYINNAVSIGGAGHELNAEAIETDANEGLGNISQDELENYLQEAGEQPVVSKKS